jgi:hypothetical protein
LDLGELLGGVDGADVGVFVERVADAQGGDAALEAGEEIGGDAFLDEQAGAGAADVALVEEDAVDDALDGLVERGVLEDDVGRLAAEFEGEFFAAAGEARWMILPTSVEPVKAILAASGWLTTAAPVSPAPVTMLTTPGGSPASSRIVANFSAVMEVVSAGLRTTVLPVARAGAIFQASMSSGKFHGMTWPTTPSGEPAAGGDVVEFVRPAGVVEEMGGGHRQVEVARLLDRLAAIEGLGDGELAGAVLEQAGDAEQVLAAFLPGSLLQKRRPFSRRPVGGIDIGGVGEGDLAELGSRRAGRSNRSTFFDFGAVNLPLMNRP